MGSAASLATLVVYAYTSFVASWGVGPDLVKKFEIQCHCHVRLVDGGDGGALLSRIKLEGKDSPVDVVIGWDRALLPRVKSELGWDEKSVAFDKGPYAFVYDSKTVSEPPHSLDDLLNPSWKGQILLEDPRLSSTGLGFLLWVIKEKGETGAWDFLRQLKPQIKIIAPSWDLAYGLFKKGQGQLVFSYWTSPAYHIQEENETRYKAASFKNGLYVQTEYMEAAPGDHNKDLKKQFMDFMISPEAQKLIPLKNFMYPVTKNTPLPPAFKQLGHEPKELPSLTDSQLKKEKEWLEKWRQIVD